MSNLGRIENPVQFVLVLWETFAITRQHHINELDLAGKFPVSHPLEPSKAVRLFRICLSKLNTFQSVDLLI